MPRLSEKVALITGGAGGIGQPLSLLMASSGLVKELVVQDHHGGRRSVRSIARSIDRIDRLIRSIRYDFRFFGNIGELEICQVSKFQLCTTLGGRKNAEKIK